jgi:ZIP family zinc transporter
VLGALLVALATGLATGLGSLPFFFVDRLPRRVYDSLLGVGAGLMLSAATLGLLPTALRQVRGPDGIDYQLLVLVVAGLGMGFLIMFVMDKNIPHWHAGGHSEHRHGEGHAAHAAGHQHADEAEHHHMDDPSPRAHRQGLLIVGAMTIHRLPEGFALGASFAVGGPHHHQLGIMLAVAIAMQNACEGVVMAAPLRHGGMRRLTTLALTAATGLSTPLGALAGYAFSHAVTAAMPVALAVAAGSLITLTSHEIIPETHSHGHEVPATLGIVSGVAAMVCIITLLGEA